MNKIEFKKLTFRNFMSYGNNLSELNFTDGLIWLSADNGSGKSTIVEVIMFALFGISYRGGNKSDLRNTRNPDGITEANLVFDRITSNGTEEYRIFRSIDPKGKQKFELERREDGKWTLMNKRVGFGQKDFEEKILQFNEVLFKNVIAMNTQESIPFIDMPAAQKRALLESIIAMSLDKWKKENGKRLSAATIEFNVATGDVSRLQSEMTSLDGIIAQMESERDSKIATLKASVADTSARITALETKLAEEHAAGYAALQNRLNGEKESLAASGEFLAASKRTYDESVAMKTKLHGMLTDESSVAERIANLRWAESAIAPLAADRQMMADLEKELAEANAAIPPVADAGERDDLTARISAHRDELRTLDVELGRHMATQQHMADEKTRLTGLAATFVAGTPCPTCGKPSTEEDVEIHKADLRKQWVAANESFKTEKEAILAMNTRKVKLTDEVNMYETRIAELNAMDTAAREYRAERIVPIEQQRSAIGRRIFSVQQTLDRKGINADRISEELDGLMARVTEFTKVHETITAKDSEWTDAVNRYNAATTEYAAVEKRIQDIAGEISRADNNTDRYSLASPATVSELAVMRNSYSNMSAALDELLNGEGSADSLAMTRQRRMDAETEYGIARARMTASSDTIKLCQYIGGNLCADSGMKKMIFGIFVPAFNNAVYKNMVRANLPFTVTFDDKMDFTFHSGPGLAPKYDMASQGQKRKIGFAISMAFRDFVSLVGNFSVNFLSLDEVLDISTDNTAMRDMLGMVKDMVSTIGCAMVITHRGDVVSDQFDYRLSIDYDGTYSRIGKLTPLH